MLFDTLQSNVPSFLMLLQRWVEDGLFDLGMDVQFSFQLGEKLFASFNAPFCGGVYFFQNSGNLLVIFLQKRKRIHWYTPIQLDEFVAQNRTLRAVRVRTSNRSATHPEFKFAL